MRSGERPSKNRLQPEVIIAFFMHFNKAFNDGFGITFNEAEEESKLFV